jgi:hypothetical protein
VIRYIPKKEFGVDGHFVVPIEICFQKSFPSICQSEGEEGA